MTKDIILKISGLQLVPQDGEEQLEVITAGSYFQRDGKHYIKYDEVTEGFSGSTSNLIKINGDTLEVTKRGLTNAHMIFQENKKNMTYYGTPFGNLLVGISATNVDVREDENKIQVEVNYALEVNYEHLADCTIHMNIQPRSTDGPELSLFD